VFKVGNEKILWNKDGMNSVEETENKIKNKEKIGVIYLNYYKLP
jgi:hypothetical protein